MATAVSQSSLYFHCVNVDTMGKQDTYKSSISHGHSNLASSGHWKAKDPCVKPHLEDDFDLLCKSQSNHIALFLPKQYSHVQIPREHVAFATSLFEVYRIDLQPINNFRLA